MVKGIEGLTEEERKALRGSKFAPLPSNFPPPSASYSSRSQPRLAHPGGPVTTNKAAALAKFLERKLQEPGGLDTINPALLESAVKNAKETVSASGTSNLGRQIRHVTSFDDCEVTEETCIDGSLKSGFKKLKGEKKQKKRKKQKMIKKNKKLKVSIQTLQGKSHMIRATSLVLT